VPLQLLRDWTGLEQLQRQTVDDFVVIGFLLIGRKCRRGGGAEGVGGGASGYNNYDDDYCNFGLPAE
jgi:hypothetical protein